MSPPTRAGFSLGEVMLALSLALVALLGLVGMQIFVQRNQRSSFARHEASTLASSKMEEISQQLKQDFAKNLTSPLQPLANHDGYSQEVAHGPDDPSLPDLRRVTVGIYWTDKTGPQSYKLWTNFFHSH